MGRYLGKLNESYKINLCYISYLKPATLAYQSAEENTGTGKNGNGAAEA